MKKIFNLISTSLIFANLFAQTNLEKKAIQVKAHIRTILVMTSIFPMMLILKRLQAKIGLP
jgi:hypothetical protein